MKIVYIDGSILNCNKIEIIGNDFFCDDYRIVNISEVDHIEED